MHKLIVALAALSASASAFGHAGTADVDVVAIESVLTALLLAGAIAYGFGVRALWRKAGIERGISRADVARFTLGWLALAAALLPSIDALANRSFALHMVQHEMLMVVAAPLIVLGRPLEAFAWAASYRVTHAASGLARTSVARKLWWLLTGTLAAWTIHAVAIWLWHVPLLFKAALSNLPLHVLQHTCFFVSALGFWWAAFGARMKAPGPSSLASLFTTMLHTSALGALLTFAPTAWYTLGQFPPFGYSAIEDQQLGGLVMWIPGSLAYVIAGLGVVRIWLNPSRRIARTQDRRDGGHALAAKDDSVRSLAPE